MDARKRPILILFALSLLGSVAWAQPGDLAAQRRTLTLELEKVEGAQSYEIEVRRRGKKSLSKPVFFRTKKARWRAALTPGIYEIRLRGLDHRGVPGEWSSPVEMQVKHPAVEMLEPLENQELAFEGASRTRVGLKWKSFSESREFVARIFSGDRLVHEEKTHRDELSVALENGVGYRAVVEADDAEASHPRSFFLKGRPPQRLKKPAPSAPPAKLKLAWFGVHSVSAAFNGKNPAYLSDLDFKDAPGLGLSFDYNEVNITGPWDFRLSSLYQFYGIKGADGRAAKAETLRVGADFERKFWLIRPGNLTARLGAGAGYDEHPEFIGLGFTGAIATKYFSSLDLRVLLGLGWEKSRKFSVSAQIEVNHPAVHFRKPGLPPKNKGHARLVLRADWRYSPSRWISVGLDGGDYNEQYGTETGMQAQSTLKLSHFSFRLGRQF